MRVLIVKTSAMGDILHALPVLSYLHQARPGIEVDWVVEEAFEGLLSGNPLISNLHVVRFKSWKKRPATPGTARQVLQVRRELAERNYDLVFDIQGNSKSGVITWLTRCPHRLGFTAEVTQERFNTLCTNRRIPLRSSDTHITDQYLRVVSVPFGRDFSTMALETDVRATDEDEKWAEQYIISLSRDLIFLFHMGTTWQTKFWYEDGWAELGAALSESYPGCGIMLTWGNEAERAEAERIASRTGSVAIIPERLSLQRLAAVVRRVDVVIGGDTGVVHLAAAVGTPTVSYYRSSDGMRSGPRGEQHRIVQTPMECACCFETKCNRDYSCRRSINPAMLLKSVKSVLQ
jgi:heptosyltransferase I